VKLPSHSVPILWLLAAGACGRTGSVAPVAAPTPMAAAPAPAPAPAPVRAPAPIPSPVAATDSALAASADRATPDEVVSTVVAVFGDSAVLRPVDSTSAADDPIWDMDVRSYETHDRVEHYVGLFSNSAAVSGHAL
jgi:hypothetical protein